MFAQAFVWRLGAVALVTAFTVAANAQEPRTHAVPLLTAAGDSQRQGFVRIVNRSEAAGEISVLAIDDAGTRHGPVTLALGGLETVHFDSNDLERGNAGKGLSGGVGDGVGDWRLELTSVLDIEALVYMRTASGFLTTMHEVVAPVREGHVVSTFNPASNTRQVSRLRVINMGTVEASITIKGRDDRGVDAPSVAARLAAGAAHTFTAQELESGEGLDGMLGDGRGKWRLVVTADQPIVVMSLLASQTTGVLTNLSSRPGGTEGFPGTVPYAFVESAPTAQVPFFSAVHRRRWSFARVVNRSDEARMVDIEAIDDAGERRTSTLALGPRQTATFNSRDLENGNVAKGLSKGVGDGVGNWRLRFSYRSGATEQPPEVLAYLRSADGLLASVHDIVENHRGRHVVPIFNPANPASDGQPTSLLRITNIGRKIARVTIDGLDDASAGGQVVVSIAAGATRTLTAAELEAGADLEGALGDGDGKWRLEIVADQPLRVMSLLENRAAGHLVNLSSRPRRDVYIADDSLRATVEGALGVSSGDAITTDQMRMLGCLWVEQRMADLTGLEAATALTLFGLSYYDYYPYPGDLSDLSPLTGLTALAVLWLGSNAIEDLSPLVKLTALERLDLSSNRIADLSPLAELTALRRLYLERNRVADISPLAALSSLVDLDLDNNSISDIAPLAGLTKLENLYLSGNSVADLSPLSALTRIERLHLGFNGLSDIAPLAWLSSPVLAELDLTGNPISDIEPLAALTTLRTLRLYGNRIADISPLSRLTNLSELDLEGNSVSDVSALVGLTALKILDLSHNDIVDLAPLLDLAASARLERLEVDYNPLSDAAYQTQVATLRTRGVEVLVHEPFPDDDDFPGSRLIRLYNDNVAVMHVPADLALGGDAAANARDFLKEFSDSFDFILFHSNLDDADDAARTTGYYGAYSHVNNDTLGIGPFGTFYDSRYGSAGKLKGVIHIPYNDHGPLLHELLHAWSQFVVPSTAGGHWGFSSAAGVHGGFKRAELVALGDGRYIAGDFGGWGGRGPYSPIELYLAGYIAAQEVPPLWVAADGQWLEDEDGLRVYDQRGINPVFTASDVREYSIDDLVAEHGPRVPNHTEAQWHFRAVAVLLTDADHPATDEQLERLSAIMTRLSYEGDDGDADYENFYEATYGRGSLTMDGLAQLRKASRGIGELPPSFGTVPPRAFCLPRPDGKGWAHDHGRHAATLP